MPNQWKVILLAVLLCISGFLAAHNARWVRDGWSPWWTSYFFSVITASTYAYLLRANLFSLTYTSVFQTFFFHASWYMTAFFVLGEHLERHKVFGLLMAFSGFIIMSIK